MPKREENYPLNWKLVLRWQPSQKRWRAQVACNNQHHDLGYFKTGTAATRAYLASIAEYETDWLMEKEKDKDVMEMRAALAVAA